MFERDMIFRAPEGAGGGEGGGGGGSESAGGEAAGIAAPEVSSVSTPTDVSPPVSSIFDGLGGDFDDDDGPSIDDSLAVETVSPPPTPPPLAPAPAPESAKAVETAPQPSEVGQPQASTAESVASPLASAPFSPETIEALESPENRDALLGQMAEAFVMTEEDLNGLATDAAPVLQRIAARVMYATTLHTLKQIQDFSEKFLPARLDAILDGRSRAEGHLNKFHRMWPALADPRYAAAIDAAAAQAKRMPGITQDGVYRTVGRMVAAQFALTALPVDISVAASGSASGPSVVVSRQAAPFSPAATAGSASHPTSGSNGGENPFAGLGMDFD